MKKNNFQIWLQKIKKSGKSDEEISEIFSIIANYSGQGVYEILMLSLTKEDIEEVEKIESQKEARKKIEELFKTRTGMSLDELAGKIQMNLIDGKN